MSGEILLIFPVLGIAGIMAEQWTKKNKGYSLIQKIAELLRSGAYPVRLLVIRKLAGKTFVAYDDQLGRFKNDQREIMKSAKDSTEMPVVDYSCYFPDKKGFMRALCLEKDKGERYPLYPLTYGDLFYYNGDTLLQHEDGTPVINEKILEYAFNSGKDDVVGLMALSKQKQELIRLQHEQDLLMHPQKQGTLSLGKLMKYGFIMIIVFAIVVIVQGVIPGLPGASKALNETVANMGGKP